MIEITLDPVRAAKLSRLSKRKRIDENTLARSLLERALEDALSDPKSVVAILNALPGALKRAQVGRDEARIGQTISLTDL